MLGFVVEVEHQPAAEHTYFRFVSKNEPEHRLRVAVVDDGVVLLLHGSEARSGLVSILRHEQVCSRFIKLVPEVNWDSVKQYGQNKSDKQKLANCAASCNSEELRGRMHGT